MPLGSSIFSYVGGGKGGASHVSKVNRSNKWEDELNDIYNQISSREKFTYDMNSDAFYKQYAQQYQQNAKLAMEDTVGQISALTGGYANSYAATAGQAMYNQQMQGLNDKAIDLYQLALQQYNMEGDRLNNLYGITADAYGMEQDRINSEVAEAQWLTEFEESQRQYNQSLAFDYARAAAQDAQWAAELAADNSQFYASLAYDKSRAKAQDAQWAQEFAYSKERDAASDAQWQQTFDYQKQRDAASDKQYAKELAYKYAALAQDQNQYNQSLALDYAELEEKRRQFDIENEVEDTSFSGFTDEEYRTFQANIADMDEKERREKYIRQAYSNGNITKSQAEALIKKYLNQR